MITIQLKSNISFMETANLTISIFREIMSENQVTSSLHNIAELSWILWLILIILFVYQGLLLELIHENNPVLSKNNSSTQAVSSKWLNPLLA